MATAAQMARLHAVVPFAQAAQRRWRVPASVTLAQWIFESSWGLDPLVAAANNCFGIKAVGGQQYVEHLTHEDDATGAHLEPAAFAKYSAIADSFDAHGRLLATSHHYILAMRALPSVRGFCKGLQDGGYSTSRDPDTHLRNYANKLYDEILAQNLTQYDVVPDPTPLKEVA